MFRSSKLSVVFCLLSVSLCLSQTQSIKTPINRVAPPFSLPTCDGKILNLADLKGSAILLEFFQTGCANCQAAAPILESLHKKYKDQGFRVVGVSFDKPLVSSVTERAKEVEPFIKEHGLTFPVLLGDSSIWANYIQKPGFNSPLIVFIDRKGMIVGQYEEGNDHKVHDIDFLEDQVKQLLKGAR